MSDKTDTLFIAVILICLTLFIAHPFFAPAHVGGHSSYVDLTRAIAWHNQAIQGQSLPRWIPEFYKGHGSPIFLFYAPASYMVIESMRSFTESPVIAIKMAYIFYIFSALSGMFLLGRKFGGNAGGLVAASALGLAPYFLLDMYVRSAVAEFSALALLPWVILALINCAQKGGSWAVVAFSGLYAILVTTHNITALIATPALALIAVVYGSRRTVIPTTAAFGCGLGFSAWFWLPALGEKELVKSTESLTGGYYHFSNHFVYLKQLFIPTWGYGSSSPGSDDAMSLQLGLALVGFAVVAISLAALQWKKLDTPGRKGLVLMGAILFGALLFTNGFTEPLWSHLPLLPFVQFPWRFLILATVAASALASFIPGLALAGISDKKLRIAFVAILVLIPIVSSFGYVKARYVLHDLNKPPNNPFVFVTSRSGIKSALAKPNVYHPEQILTIENIKQFGATSTSRDDYLPRTVTGFPGGVYLGFIVEPHNSMVHISDKEQKGADIRFVYTANTPAEVRIEPFYFPGWRATLKDGTRLPIQPIPGNGWIKIKLPPGDEAEVRVTFGDTPIRTVGKIISFAAVLFMGIWLTLRKSEKEASG